MAFLDDSLLSECLFFASSIHKEKIRRKKNKQTLPLQHSNNNIQVDFMFFDILLATTKSSVVYVA